MFIACGTLSLPGRLCGFPAWSLKSRPVLVVLTVSMIRYSEKKKSNFRGKGLFWLYSLRIQFMMRGEPGVGSGAGHIPSAVRKQGLVNTDAQPAFSS